MANALSAANLVVSRAGAGSISEFALLGKAVILVPSPNVSEDHQTKNAMALVNKNAAIYVADAKVKDELITKAIETVNDDAKIAELEENTDQKYEKLYVVGGGAKNTFLNHLTEEATGKRVVALPIEATALGNLKIQMEADDELS
jgi:ribulose kinase